MKTCSRCGETKSVGDFYQRRNVCKLCISARNAEAYAENPGLYRQRVSSYQAANPERVLDQQSRARLKKYGLTPEAYDELFERQGGRCAICRGDQPGRYWCVDHDHSSGAVRGILCWHCNVGLGHFKDDASSLLAAVDYLAQRGVASDGTQSTEGGHRHRPSPEAARV